MVVYCHRWLIAPPIWPEKTECRRGYGQVANLDGSIISVAQPRAKSPVAQGELRPKSASLRQKTWGLLLNPNDRDPMERRNSQPYFKASRSTSEPLHPGRREERSNRFNKLTHAFFKTWDRCRIINFYTQKGRCSKPCKPLRIKKTIQVIANQSPESGKSL